MMRTDRRKFLKSTLYFSAAAALPLRHFPVSSAIETLPTLRDTAASLALPSKQPFPELKVSGSPGAMGHKHGKTFASQVKHNIGFYLRYLSNRTGSEEKELLSCASRFEEVIAKHFPELLEEMQGIAKGARTGLDEVIAVNARTDLLVLAKKKKKKQDPREQETSLPGCTALALVTRVKGREKIALGQNWDWNRALRKNSVILRLRPTKGRRIVTFTEAGMVGKIGFNDMRLGVCLNFLSHSADKPEGEPGVPVHLLLRAVMTCDTIEEASELIANTPRCASANFLIAQSMKHGVQALDLEWTSKSVAELPAEDGILVHTNHFKDKTLGGRTKSGDSFERDARAVASAAELREKVKDPAERMKRVLSLGDKNPVPLSRGITQAGIVMDLSRNKLHLCSGPPHKGKWVVRPGA